MLDFHQMLRDLQENGTAARLKRQLSSGEPPSPHSATDDAIPGQAGQPDYLHRAVDLSQGHGPGPRRTEDDPPEVKFARLMYPVLEGKYDDPETFRDVTSGKTPPPMPSKKD